MRRYLPTLLLLLVFFFVFWLSFRSKTSNVSAAPASHVVISEIQIAGATSTDEFIELYNPTESGIDLTTWRLGRKTQSGADATDLVASLSGTIKARGYFLIASDSFSGGISADVTYASASSSIANNNSVTLYDNLDAPVDLVGLGGSTASETATIGNPSAGDSVERKANSSSDSTTMGSGGTDEFAGNGEDTDNNSSDFVSRSTPQPQNSDSSVEPPITPSPSPTETLTPTLSPTPSEEPSPMPTEGLTPTLSPTPSPIPSPTLSPTPTGPAPKLLFRGLNISCSLNYRLIRFFGANLFWPFVSCTRI